MDKEKELSLHYFAQIIAFFSHRGTSIFNCGEAFLLKNGFSYKDIDQINEITVRKYDQKPAVEQVDNFEGLIKELKIANFDDAAKFVEGYRNGNKNKSPEEQLVKEGLTDRGLSSLKMEKKEEKRESVINLLKNLEETKEALIMMEGEDWFEKQKSWGEYGIQSAISEANKGRRSEIYGNDGFRRYIVTEDGAVYLASSKATKEKIEQAKKLGFLIA